MKQNIPISKIMSTDLVTATVNDDFSEVKERMSKNCIRHMLIVEGKHLIGVLSQSDVLKYSISEAFAQGEGKANDKVLDPLITIGEIMTTSIITLKDYDTVKHAVEIFINNSFHSIPVVDKEGGLVGVISTDDMITYLMRQY